MDAGTINILLKATDQASSVLKDVDQAAGGVGPKMGEIARTAGGFVVGAALTNLPGKLFEMAKGAADDAASTAKLEQAVKNADGSFGPYAQAIDQAIASGQAKGFSDDQVRDGLALLTATTGDTDEALRRMSLAQDLSRGTGMDLVTASKLLGRVNDENVSVLSRYGIQVDKNATAQDLLNAVDGKFGGQAATFAASDAGKMAIMTDKVGELQEQLGAYLIPVLALVVGGITGLIDGASRILGAFQPVVSFVQGNLIPILIFLAPAFVGVAFSILSSLIPALLLQIPALYASVAGWLAMNAAMLPIIGVFVLIGAALVLLWLAWQNNFLNIQGIVGAMVAFVTPAFDAIVNVFQVLIPAAIQTMTGYWNALVAIVTGVIGIVSALLTGDFAGAWDAAKTMVSGVIDAIGQIVGGLPATVAGVILDMATQAATLLAGWAVDAATKAGEILSGIVDAISSLPDKAYTTFDSARSKVAEVLDDLISKAPGWGRDILQGVINGITGLFGSLAGAMSAMKTAVLDGVSGAGSWLYSAGRDIISGLIGGIEDMAWQAAQAAINVVKGAIDAAKGWLGISSPSRVAHELIGMPFSQGVARGILSGIGEITRAGQQASRAALAPVPTGGMAGMAVLRGGMSGDIAGADGGGRRGTAAVAAGVTVQFNAPVTIQARDRADAERSARDIGWAVTAALRARGAA